ncbi:MULTISPECIES: hypothetical protein [Pacificibacter]|uniref:hypothetical protein n=1 Tax=Pacificibacter TaxID=1042323 RepID=UPI001C0843D1|nr:MULTISPECIES: hypothetical protein [Pacificibacter]MBU2935989.1 hypothetical protein [Pacificibacter marinus]MDO6615162.1 hypothetical protein [Pacificibacter sp. 1_MG-2023]
MSTVPTLLIFYVAAVEVFLATVHKEMPPQFTMESAKMSLRVDRIITILKPSIPVREGTRLYTGFEELSTCNGKTYGHFRSLCGGPVGHKGRRFSPSAVWKSAEACGFARLEDAIPSRTLQNDIHDVCVATNSQQDNATTHFQALNDVRQLIVADGVSIDLPGIYAWKIDGIGIYVGKYTRKSRPLREYNKNVRHLLNGEMYRPQNPTGFRRVHHALARAVTDGLRIELHILENCSPENLNAREQHLISTIACGNLNG